MTKDCRGYSSQKATVSGILRDMLFNTQRVNIQTIEANQRFQQMNFLSRYYMRPDQDPRLCYYAMARATLPVIIANEPHSPLAHLGTQLEKTLQSQLQIMSIPPVIKH
jgi:hypothetical protein